MAPLNWGLGHATRCIPIIRELQRQGATVVIASDGGALALLQQMFSDLTVVELPGYNIKYSGQFMAWNMARQLPKIVRAIWAEHRAIKNLVAHHNINGIISDNRFGCFSAGIHAVFLTHQVNIQVPFWGIKDLVNFFNHLFINQFATCWIPDKPGTPNLSGALSHPAKPILRKKVKYIGALSQLRTPIATEQRYDAIAVLSGPEPQRTRFEKALIEQTEHLAGRFLIVQGKPEEQSEAPVLTPKNTEIIPLLTGELLQQAILESSVFIGRSGYSTIMDLAKMRKPALLIPTPGQTEQEYLAAKFLGENVFFTQKQGELNLEEGIAEAKKRSGLQADFFDEKAMSNAVASFIASC